MHNKMLLQSFWFCLFIFHIQGSDNYETTSAFIDTVPAVYDITAHLVGGSTDSNGAWGRLELTVNGERGVVDAHTWTSSESTVACRNLGYSNVIYTMAGADYGAGYEYGITEPTPSINYRSMTCNGHEETLSECNFSLWGKLTWLPTVVILHCFIKESAIQVVHVSSGEYRLRSEFIGEFRIKAARTRNCHGYTCFKHPDYQVAEADAHVLCKTAKKRFAITSQKGWRSFSDKTVQFSYVCSGHETHIGYCPYTYFGFSEDYYNVHCTDEMTLRIDLGQTLVVINSQEYAIGDLDWDDSTAAVACRSLGIKGAATLGTTVDNHWHLRRLVSQKLVCQGNETNLFECTEYDALIEAPSFSHYHTMSASCGGKRPEVELTIKSDTATVGRLQALVDGMLGCVCDYGWNEKAASVACNMMGQRSGQVIALLDASAQGLGEIEEYEFTWVRYTYCKGDEKHLWDCLGDVYPYEASPCPDDHLAGIVCDVTKTEIQISLTGGSHPGEGRVVVTIDGVAGSIGWQDWDDKDARIVCKMLGLTYSSAVSSLKTVFGTNKGPLYFDNVPCTGEEGHILDCFNGKLGWTTKKQNDADQVVAGVVCTAGPLSAGTSSDRTTLLVSVGVLAALLVVFIVGMLVLVILYCRRSRNPDNTNPSNPSKVEMVNQSRGKLKEERESEMYEDLDDIQKKTDETRRPYATLGTMPQ